MKSNRSALYCGYCHWSIASYSKYLLANNCKTISPPLPFSTYLPNHLPTYLPYPSID